MLELQWYEVVVQDLKMSSNIVGYFKEIQVMCKGE